MSLTAKIKAIFNMQGNQIKNVAAPTDVGDVTTKAYVDAAAKDTYGVQFLDSVISSSLAADNLLDTEFEVLSFTIPANSLVNLGELRIRMYINLYSTGVSASDSLAAGYMKYEITNDGNTDTKESLLMGATASNLYVGNSATNWQVAYENRLVNINGELRENANATIDFVDSNLIQDGAAWDNFSGITIDFTKDIDVRLLCKHIQADPARIFLTRKPVIYIQ